MKRKRYVTVNTDAGIKAGVAAYAYWIKSDHNILKGSGLLISNPKNSNEAEIAAILIALAVVADSYRGLDYVIVNCDNTQALHVLRSNQINGHEKYAQTYKDLKEKLDCPIQYRHVRGHSMGRSSREWVNNWCDKELRKHYT